jgi:hypothetical protein
LVDCGLLRPKTEVGWRPVAREKFPTEGTSETVVFLAHIECGFRAPTGDFIRDLLFFYRIELVYLSYLGIAPHFHLWCHFFKLKKTGKSKVVRSMGFMLRWNMKCVANMAPFSTSSSLTLVIHDNMINGTNHIV